MIPAQSLPDEDRQTMGRHVGAFRRHWLVMLLAVIAAVVSALVWVQRAEKRYEAQAEVLVSPIRDADNTFVGIDLLTDPDTSVLVVGRNLSSPQLAAEVARRLRLGVTGRELLRSVSMKPLQQSGIVTVTAGADTPAGAAAIANEFATTLVRRRTARFQRELSAQITRLRRSLESETAISRTETLALQERLAALRSVEGARDPTVAVLNRAVPPQSAAWPRPVLTVTIALVIGLVLAVGGAFVLDFIDPRIVNEREILDRLPVVAWIPRAPTSVVKTYLAGEGQLPPDLWEAYRTLRASLSTEGVGGGTPKSILVTSAIKAEGKTMTSVNLAVALAAGGSRVILVEGDLRRPGVARTFGASDVAAGFPALLYGTANPEELLVQAPGYGPNIQLLLAGSERPIDLLDARRVQAVIADLKSLADVVIVDSPPVTEFADAVALSDAVDIVLIAVRLGYSRRDRFNELMRFLSTHRIEPAGFVVTSRRRSRTLRHPPERTAPIEAQPEVRGPVAVGPKKHAVANRRSS
jgi:succinoglycan biosynthesis transport protein ExoP